MRADLGSGNFIEYETFGSARNPCILLIMGLATSLLAWREEFCAMLVERGYFVVRFDNRDVGLSKHWDEEFGAPPLIRRALALTLLGRLCPTVSSPYTLSDMGADAFGLLDHLKVERAHLVGASLGGMIAQTMALDEPGRVASLCSISSTTGARNLPNGEFSLRLRLLKRPRTSSHDDRSDQLLRTLTLVSHPAPLSPDTPEYVSNAVRRNPFKPTSNARQLNAVIAQADRTHRLGSLALPCLIVHGSDDRLVPLAHGEATARAIGGDTRTLVIEGMGHVMTSDFYQQVIDAIVSNSKRTMGHDGLGER